MAYPNNDPWSHPDAPYQDGAGFDDIPYAARLRYFTSNFDQWGMNDINRQYYADLAMRSVDWNHDEMWYQAHQSRQAQYQEMRDLGINPLTAARSVAGIQDAGSPSAGAYPSATGNEAFRSVMEAFGSGANALNSLFDINNAKKTTDANVANTHADTANKVAENPWIAPQAKANIATKEAQAAEASANVGVLNARQKQIIAETGRTEKECQMIEKQLSRFDELTDAQINQMQTQARLYFEQALTQQKEREQIDANIALTNSKTQETQSNTVFINQETQQLMTINEFCAQIGVPMNADFADKMNFYSETGDYKAAQRLLDATFDAAAARGAGDAAGSVPIKYQYHQPETLRGAMIKGISDFNKPGIFHYYNRGSAIKNPAIWKN